MDTDESPPKRPTKKAPSISEIFRANSARTARQKAKERSAHPEHGSNAKAGPSMTSGAPPLSGELRSSLKEGLTTIDDKGLKTVRDKYTQLIRIESNIAALKKSIDQSQIPTYLKISIAPRVSQD